MSIFVRPRGLNVLSLFNGMGVCAHALKSLGVTLGAVYVSEIDKYANIINEKNHPESIQLGDVNAWEEWNIPWGDIDLITGGFPCQAWSVAGSQLGIRDPRGRLFWVTLDIIAKVLEHNPRAKFMMENVKMKQEFEEYITRHTSESLGYVEKVMIDSQLLTAQRRKRYYWTNFSVTQPDDFEIMLKDVVHEYVDDYDPSSHIVSKLTNRVIAQLGDLNGKSNPLLASMYKGNQSNGMTNIFVPLSLEGFMVPVDDTLHILNKEVERGKAGFFRKDSQANRVYYIHDKAITLCGDAGGGAAKMGQYLFGCITPNRLNKNQNGQRFSNSGKFYTLTVQDRHGVLLDGYIRKITPIECARLQGMPDLYAVDPRVSATQQYKMYGNGWTSPVVQHIFTAGLDMRSPYLWR